MLHIETTNSRIFTIDLGEVVALDYADGVLSFHTERRSFTLGGVAWGGPVSHEDANAIIIEWRNHRQNPVEDWEDDEDDEDLEYSEVEVAAVEEDEEDESPVRLPSEPRRPSRSHPPEPVVPASSRWPDPPTPQSERGTSDPASSLSPAEPPMSEPPTAAPAPAPSSAKKLDQGASCG